MDLSISSSAIMLMKHVTAEQPELEINKSVDCRTITNHHTVQRGNEQRQFSSVGLRAGNGLSSPNLF